MRNELDYRIGREADATRGPKRNKYANKPAHARSGKGPFCRRNWPASWPCGGQHRAGVEARRTVDDFSHVLLANWRQMA
jgi:hypothetical protein